MSIATTAIDHLPETRMTVIGNLLMLLGADTLLYRAHESEIGLKQLQVSRQIVVIPSIRLTVVSKHQHRKNCTILY